MTPEMQILAEDFLAAEKILIFTHERPDGDALGSTFGFRAVLRSLGKTADVVIPAELPNRYQQLCTGAVTQLSADQLADCDLIAVFDCATRERIALPSGIDAAQLLDEHKSVNLDHHAANQVSAGKNAVVHTASSTAYLASVIAMNLQPQIPAEAATMFLTGMMTDTGRFCFTNTDSQTMMQAARMLEAGADVESISNHVFFSKPLRIARFEAELMNTELQLACGNRFAFADVREELLEKHQVELREDEGLIDLLRELEGVVVAMLVCRRGDAFKISLRSKDSRYPVGPLARKYQGGGHDLAAGLTLHLESFEAVNAFMIREIGQLLDGDR